MSDRGDPGATPPRVLVIDDERQIRKLLEISLRSQGYQVLEAATGREGLELLATRGADVVVLDLGLPDLEGHEVLSELRAWSQVPVVVLSVRASETEKVLALDGGANDYVTKPFGIQELMARIRGLLRRPAGGGEALAVFDDGRLHIDLARRAVSLEGRDVRFTRKEFAFLALLVRNGNRVVTQQQILRELWGPTHVEDTQYLRVVVGRIRQKLADDPARPRYLQTEPGIGYRFLGETAAR